MQHTPPSDENTIEIKAMTDAQVSDFLRNDPQFFERNAHLLAEIYLPSPHGNGAISLTERQQLAQRDKIRVSEAMLAQMIAFGEENDITSSKVHDLSLALLSNTQLDQIQNIVTNHMQEAFSVTHASLHCWIHSHDKANAQDAIFDALPEKFSDWVMTLNAPNCGAKAMEAEILINEKILDEKLQSFAFIPLFKNLSANTNIDAHLPAMGVLILASEDVQHFKADMGTLFLKRIGDLVSTALIHAL